MDQPLAQVTLETPTNSLILQLKMQDDFQADTMFAIGSITDKFLGEASPLVAAVSSVDTTFDESLDHKRQHPLSDTCPEAYSVNVDIATPKPAGLLRLPLETRQLIYQELLSDMSLTKAKLDWRAPQSRLGMNTSFPPSKRNQGAYEILLTCRQCYDEGIIFYYRWAKVSDFGHLDRWCLQKPPAYHAQQHTQDCSYTDLQCFPTYMHTKFVLPGVTSNLSMVMKYSQEFVEIGTFWLSNFRFAESARQVTIKLPLRRVVRGTTWSANTLFDAVPSDDQVLAQHSCYLPSRRNGYHLQYRHHKWEVPDRHKNEEEEVIEKLINQSRIKFIARFPIVYSANRKDNWEICEYNLKSQQLIHRFETSAESVSREGYPDLVTSLGRFVRY